MNEPARPTTVPPPTKHQLALMIWVAVVPTLIGLNLLLTTPSPTSPQLPGRSYSPRSRSRSSSTA